jgi:uncharacterized membrane protein YqjE
MQMKMMTMCVLMALEQIGRDWRARQAKND